MKILLDESVPHVVQTRLSHLAIRTVQDSGLSTKRAVVEEGLRLLIKVKGQASIRRLRGKIDSDGYALDAGVEDRVQ